MKKVLQKILPVVIVMMFTTIGYAQNYLPQNKVWAFGYNAGIDFNGATPVAIKTNIDGSAYASVSDEEGNLLFYTDGNVMWNKNHDTLQNSILWPEIFSSYYPRIINVLITSNPGNLNQYYVFSMYQYNSATTVNDSLFYSIVDMTLDNGLGGVVPGAKKIKLATGLAPKLAAVQGDSCNLWLAVRSTSAAQYKCFHITASGIDTTPVVSNIGTLGAVNYYQQPSLVFSPDRTKAVVGGKARVNQRIMAQFFEMYDFNPATGIFSNATQLAYYSAVVTLDNVGFADFNLNDIVFSPDGSKLYAVVADEDIGTTYSSERKWLRQFDLAQNNLVTTYPIKALRDDGAIELAPDGKIYFGGASDQYLGRINYPDAAGLAADARDSVIQLMPGTSYRASNVGSTSLSKGRGLINPSIILLPTDTQTTVSDSLICNTWSDGVVLTPTQADSAAKYIWDNGETTKQRTVSTAGTYWVKYRNQCTVYIDSFVYRGSDLFTTITVNGFTLGATGGPFLTYQWYLNENAIPGATDSSYDVTANGDYTVVVTNEEGCSYLSDVYQIKNYEDVSVTEVEQVAAAIKVYPNPTSDKTYINSPVRVNVSLSGIDGRLYYRENNALSIPVEGLNSGIYFLGIYDEKHRLIKVEKVIKR